MIKMIYRVWYGDHGEKEAFFSEEDAAKLFAELMHGYLSEFKWEIKVEARYSV